MCIFDKKIRQLSSRNPANLDKPLNNRENNELLPVTYEERTKILAFL
jgi:hypothetical protein